MSECVKELDDGVGLSEKGDEPPTEDIIVVPLVSRSDLCGMEVKMDRGVLDITGHAVESLCLGCGEVAIESDLRKLRKTAVSMTESRCDELKQEFFSSTELVAIVLVVGSDIAHG